MLKDYFLTHHTADLQRILNAPDPCLCYSIEVNFLSLFEFEPDSAQKILQHPRYWLPLCDEAAIKSQEEIAKPHEIIKKRVRTRITAVPVSIHQGQSGGLLSVSGITVRTSQPTCLKLIKRFSCKSCKHITVVKLQWERQDFPNVKHCGKCHEKGVKPLGNAALEQEDCADYQEIRLQENRQTTGGSSYVAAIQVVLLDDLVDKCRPGDSVDICGVIIQKWGPLKPGRLIEPTTSFFLANSVSVRRKLSVNTVCSQKMKEMFQNYWQEYQNNVLAGRDNILASICPQLYGMYPVKLALGIVLAGGVPKTNESGARIRGESHLLLIGDPGTGKSQLLCTASRLAARSVLTTGIGTTAAGLTAAAVKDADGWHLEGGALVLADGGVCCVDEFTTMSSQDRASLHEAMEQQTISIAKAGLVSTLNSRCTVIAAANPKGGRFTDNEEWKTNLGNPLLSRFDLIILLRDNSNPEWDKLISDHILKAACESGENTSLIEPQKQANVLTVGSLWKEDSLREYLAYVHTLKPTLTQEAEKVLRATYLFHRSNPYRRAERTTVRMLESLIRLAEGHARLMCRSEITIMDAIVAAELMGTANNIEADTGSPFPDNPMETYRSKGKELLGILGLQNLESLL